MPVPVLGISEAAMLTACMLGGRFSILTLAPRVVPIMEDLVASYGLASRLASVRVLERSPVEIARVTSSVDGNVADASMSAALLDSLVTIARAAVHEDGADVIVVGATSLAAVANELQQRVEVPVLDGIGCGVRHLESLLAMRVRKPRAGAFAFPPAKEVVGVPASLAGRFTRPEP
jgi:Asp/Glu/hydantoin racemase